MIPLGIFSTPNTSTVSYWPAPIAWRAELERRAAARAARLDVDDRHAGAAPSAPSTLWPVATPPYAVPQNAAWNPPGPMPASARAWRTAVTPRSTILRSSNRPNGWMPTPAISTSTPIINIRFWRL